MTPNDQLDSDLNQATRLVEVERAQIGHEIHDGLLPLIFAASAGVTSILQGNADAREQEEKLKQVSRWLDDALQSGRQLLAQVYPPELTGTLWTHAAKGTLERLFPESQSRIDFQFDPGLDQTSLPIAIAAYRIVVEAVRNAVGHGEASHVVVSGEKTQDGFRITVRDNGHGFDLTQVPDDRYGIRSMKGRAQMVGGTLDLDSSPGGPTTVTFLYHSKSQPAG